MPTIDYNDKGWRQIKKNLKLLEEARVRAGFLGEKAAVPKKATTKILSHAGKTRRKYRKTSAKTPNVAMVARILEFGTSDGRVPSRSVIRSSMAEGKVELEALSARVVNFAFNPANDEKAVEKKLQLMGLKMQSMIKGKITSITSPALKPSTIKRKGSSKPWIDTGQLRSSVTYDVVMQVAL